MYFIGSWSSASLLEYSTLYLLFNGLVVVDHSIKTVQILLCYSIGLGIWRYMTLHYAILKTVYLELSILQNTCIMRCKYYWKAVMDENIIQDFNRVLSLDGIEFLTLSLNKEQAQSIFFESVFDRFT